jgi:hypothetical protein
MNQPDPDAERMVWDRKPTRSPAALTAIDGSAKNKGIFVNHKAVFRLMNKLNIHSVVRKRKNYRKATELGTYHRYENVHNHDFTTTRPNQK